MKAYLPLQIQKNGEIYTFNNHIKIHYATQDSNFQFNAKLYTSWILVTFILIFEKEPELLV